ENGLIICNVSLTLYSDDTPGNVSEKTQQTYVYILHFIRSPPKLRDQESNVHTVACSNIASMLELADQIVDEVK
ncbi:hypothetical protein CROQUDRAFT_43302, partial [Cronartium quercuum f. sp. fusiforme G11]